MPPDPHEIETLEHAEHVASALRGILPQPLSDVRWTGASHERQHLHHPPFQYGQHDQGGVWVYFVGAGHFGNLLRCGLLQACFDLVAILRTIILINMVFHFFTGYCDDRNLTVVMKPSKIVKRYLLTYFIFDLFIIIPMTVYRKLVSYSECIVFFAQIPIFIRAYTCQNLMKKFLMLWNFSELVISVISFMFGTLHFIHYFSCCIYIIPQCVSEVTNDTTITNIHKMSNDTWDIYVSSFWRQRSFLSLWWFNCISTPIFIHTVIWEDVYAVRFLQNFSVFQHGK